MQDMKAAPPQPATTTLEEARQLVDRAIQRCPELNVFGIGLFYQDYREPPAVQKAKLAKQQLELYDNYALNMVAWCKDWLDAHKLRKTINRRAGSYFLKHVVEHYRRRRGDPDPYTYNGAFIAAALGMGLKFKADRSNVLLPVSDRDLNDQSCI